MTPPAPLLRDALEPWCAAGVTGALRLLENPGGTVYLSDGRIAYAECPAACGVERLLTASGRLPGEAWRAAANVGRNHHRIGAELVQSGLITQAEIEAAGVLALYDAAFFLFDLATPVQFEPGARQPVGQLCSFELRTVCQEVDRRKRFLAEAWHDPSSDTAAVLPHRRLRSQIVALTALQWEVVANADRRRSPVDLARLLGRDTYTVMLEVRRLVRAGLVEPGRPGGSAAAESLAAVRARAAEPPPVMARPAPAEEPPAMPARVRLAAETADSAEELPALPRREVKRQPASQAGQTAENWVPEHVLHRLINGIGAL
ncbi:hypothetical protein Rhe02_72200 [Rhizocola hellebori]|uniref:MarR family transcriptional regulator n=1 Tax=Rhizocola hellebori TaxID=1392758 RepID=A0A8J3QE02_9ACTN|nr:hypothetical protein [Rhizocola hellebori]GIH09153.1 hypothetical protein Rhe02_72200 [Rhizocola hellebori]